jgi:predicted RND superfamily exporter protein
MKQNKSLLKSFIFLVIPTILLFWWTHDLKQNNKEYLFLNKSLKINYEEYISKFGNDDQLMIEIPLAKNDDDELVLSKLKMLEEKLKSLNIEQFTTPKETTKKKNHKEWIDFYQKHPEMEFKLATTDSLFVIVLLPELTEAKQIEIYDQLTKLPLKLKMAGMSYTNYHLNKMGDSIQKILFPILFILTLLISYLYYRNLEITLFVFINSLFATMIGLFIIKIIYHEANILTTSVPLINFVTTQSLSIHLISGLFTFQTLGLTYKRKLTPMLLMVGSTIAGFFSLITSDIIAVKQFALTSSLALFVTTLFYLFFWKFLFKNIHFNKMMMLPLNLFYAPKFVTKKLVYSFSIICLLFSIYAYPRLKTTVEALTFFPKNHELIQSFKSIDLKLGGTPKLDLVIEKKDHKEFDFEDLKKLSILELALKNKISNAHQNFKLVSKVALIKNANYAYTNHNEFPSSEVQATTLFSQIPETLKNSFNNDLRYHINILGPTMTTESYQELIREIDHFFKTQDNNMTLTFNGLNYTLMKSQTNLIHSLIESLGLSIILVCLIVGISFRDLKKLSHFIISNTPPITLTIVLIYISGMALNISTIKTFSISFGMIFDSTIHLLYNYKRTNLDPAIFQQAVLNPIYLSSFVTIASFIMFGFHDFVPIKEFGILLAFLLTLGLFFDVLMLPVLENKK